MIYCNQCTERPYPVQFQENHQGEDMGTEGRVARVTEIVADSRKSFEDAILNGFRRASKTLRGITGIRVKEQYAEVDNGAILKFRVTLDVIFVLDS
jgi:flavin-binding protein dodecin